MEQEENNEGFSEEEASYGSSVKFSDSNEFSPVYLDDEPKLHQFIMKYSGGLVKDKKQAEVVIIGIIILNIVIALVLFHSGSQNNSSEEDRFVDGASVFVE